MLGADANDMHLGLEHRGNAQGSIPQGRECVRLEEAVLGMIR